MLIPVRKIRTKHVIQILSVFLIVSVFLFANPEIKRNINTGITNVGVAYFGIQSKFWPCNASYNALKNVKNIHISFLWKTFGTNIECLEKFIADPRLQTLQVHLTNGSALRNKVLRPYEPLRGENVSSLNSKLESRDKKTLKIFGREMNRANTAVLSKLDQGQACIISPILEGNLSSKAANNLFTYLKKRKPRRCLLVYNSAGVGGQLPKGADLMEGHGKNSIICRYCVTNLDGTDIDFPFRRTVQISNHIKSSEVMRYIEKRAKVVVNYLWIQEFNGKKEQSTRSDTRKRKDYPNSQLFRAVANFIVRAENKK